MQGELTMDEKLLPGQWSKEKVWQWYNSRKWLRGCNYLQADCIDPFEQWQEYDFDNKLKWHVNRIYQTEF
jgi:hypothetical protein